MKKLILTAAAAMMVLASCTKTTVESNDGPQEIAFKKIEGAMTKETLDQMNDGTMGVFAYLNGTTTPYFGNASFSKDGSHWSGDKYWPLNKQALDFAVYAPYIADATFNCETKTLSYTVTDNKTAQIDYLYGSEYYDNNSPKEDKGFVYDANGVAVNLKHALAKITVTVKATAENVFTINTMTLNNTEQGGVITVVYDGSNDAASVTSCEATSEGTTVEDVEMTLFSLPATVIDDETATTKSCLVFPGDNTHKRYQTSLTITYTIAGVTSPQTTTLNLQPDPNNPSLTWDSGKHYVYKITLNANEILFTPTVEEWATTGVNYVETEPGL